MICEMPSSSHHDILCHFLFSGTARWAPKRSWGICLIAFCGAWCTWSVKEWNSNTRNSCASFRPREAEAIWKRGHRSIMIEKSSNVRPCYRVQVPGIESPPGRRSRGEEDKMTKHKEKVSGADRMKIKSLTPNRALFANKPMFPNGNGFGLIPPTCSSLTPPPPLLNKNKNSGLLLHTVPRPTCHPCTVAWFSKRRR